MSKINHRAAALNLVPSDEVRPAHREEKARRRDKAVPKRARQVRYEFDANAQTAPNVGESVAIRHKTEETSNGQVRLVRAPIESRIIAAVYMGTADGYCIKDNCGESWLVRPAAVGGTKWESFNRGETRKELV